MNNNNPVQPSVAQQQLAVLAIILGSVVTVSMGQGLATTWDTIVGLIMGICLWNYGSSSYVNRSRAGLIAMAWAFCILLVVSPGVDVIFLCFLEERTFEWHTVFQQDNPMDVRHLLHFGIWIILSAIVFLVISQNKDVSSK